MGRSLDPAELDLKTEEPSIEVPTRRLNIIAFYENRIRRLTTELRIDNETLLRVLSRMLNTIRLANRTPRIIQETIELENLTLILTRMLNIARR